MWWKMPVLMVLGSPLLWWASREIATQPAITRPDDSKVPSGEELSKRRGEQQTALKTIEADAIDDDLARLILSASLDKEPPSSNRSDPNKKLFEALRKHQAAIEQVRCLTDDIVACEEKLEGDPSWSCKQKEYVAWLNKRRELVKTKLKELDGPTGGPPGPRKTLNNQLTAVSDKLKGRQPGKFTRELKMDLDELQTNLEGGLSDLIKFRKECADFSILCRELDQKVHRGKACDQLIRLVVETNQSCDEKKNPTLKSVLDLMKRHADLVEDSLLPDGKPDTAFQGLVRHQASVFAAEYLLGEMKDDGMVLFFPRGQKSGDEVSKDELNIVWKEDKPPEALTKFPDISSIPFDKVAYVVREYSEGGVKKTPQGKPLIEETPRNKAMSYYNDKRRSLRINEVALRVFLNGCPVKWTGDRDPPKEFQRVEHLLAAVKKYPNLCTSNR